MQEKRNQLAHVSREVSQIIGCTRSIKVDGEKLRKYWIEHNLPIANSLDSLKKYKHLHPTFQMMLTYKNHQNYLKTWGQRLLGKGITVDDGVLLKARWRSFTSYTGRIYASNLPLTSMPTEMRDYIVAPKGH